MKVGTGTLLKSPFQKKRKQNKNSTRKRLCVCVCWGGLSGDPGVLKSLASLWTGCSRRGWRALARDFATRGFCHDSAPSPKKALENQVVVFSIGRSPPATAWQFPLGRRGPPLQSLEAPSHGGGALLFTLVAPGGLLRVSWPRPGPPHSLTRTPSPQNKALLLLKSKGHPLSKALKSSF